MKLILSLLLLLSFPAERFAGLNFYVSSSTGSDLNSGTEASPFKTIAKAITLCDGDNVTDNIYLKRGDTFNERYVIEWNSNEVTGFYLDGKDYIAFSDYGSGSKPVLTSLDTVGAWTSAGGNLWEATLDIPQGKLHNIYYNDTIQNIGRYPKVSAVNEGWLTIDNTNFLGGARGQTNGTIVCDEFPNQSLVGGDVVVRKNRYIADAMPILTHNVGADEITYMNTGGFGINLGGWGLFVQNCLPALTQDGDWMFDNTTNKITMYFAVNPNDVAGRVKYSSVRRGIWLLNSNNISFSNIAFKGFNEYGIFSQQANNITFQNSSMDGIGFIGWFDLPQTNHGNNIQIIDSRFTNCYSGSINMGNAGKGVIIERDTVLRSGAVTGAYRWVDNSTTDNIFSSITDAIVSQGDSSLIRYNYIQYVGYNAINFNGSNTQIKYNYIDSFGVWLDDGGGAYTFKGGDTATNIAVTNTIVERNIILHGVGNGYGTNAPTNYTPMYGLYSDDNHKNIVWKDNTVAYTFGAMQLHNSTFEQIRGNSFYDNYEGYFANADNPPNLRVRNNTLKGNTTFSKPGQSLSYYRSDYSDIGQNYYDSNYYIQATPVFRYTPTTLGSETTGGIAAVQAFGIDVNSTFPFVGTADNLITLAFNKSFSAAFVSLPGTFITPAGVTHVGSIYLQGRGGIILKKLSDVVGGVKARIGKPRFSVISN